MPPPVAMGMRRRHVPVKQLQGGVDHPPHTPRRLKFNFDILLQWPESMSCKNSIARSQDSAKTAAANAGRYCHPTRIVILSVLAKDLGSAPKPGSSLRSSE